MKKRNIIQLIVFLLSLGILSFVIVAGKKSIHNVCPYAVICFGMLKGNFFSLSLQVAALGIVLGLAFMLISMFWGRIFCGYICPLGTFQEGLYALFRKKGARQIPYFHERTFSKLKYWVLALTFILVIVGLSWIYTNFCPFYTLSRLPTLALGGLITLAIIIIGSIFLQRFWCRFLCPYAALLNLSQKLGELFGIPRRKIHRNLERCIDCGLCAKNCPMNLEILNDEYVDSLDCIHCRKCLDACPKPGTISQRRNS
ncbi:MAG: 4Fe-4S binding protein [Candidatus Cloacimonadaceae bacterium]|jgi:polyferredoxin|nr:4Fe-4S binding protein [Candidatus Cloacimonadota bacterium]MDY0127150.1 4Fe-4S binding protein [Candidatus Cloacimonadaceae bacterium]MCB5255172.1 4Fe-4S binding protein [Candidatus Cloacimonadota bacterium]MCK9177645.1 4Fe-4S binding protein [Candidatus Cloacimonadota bacterium]MCK9242632.1 4Fe-4S binding protein [Candidatus Cloacimonadota bacterium]